MPVKRLQNTWLVAGDVAATRDFYEHLLGLEVKFADGSRWVQFAAGGTNFAIGATGEYPVGLQDSPAGAIPVFEIDDMDERRQKLAVGGVEVLELRDMGSHGRVLTVRDPDGHIVQLFERAAESCRLG
ncbi:MULTISPECIES: VOC family protein [Rhizobium]|uniref:VOC family protein n=1 Tax=Rhizobium TaxID=379 RepID=UPI001956D2F5|nr:MULTISPECIES: VOC family protein [Rhizobium]MBM7044718.1 VOC family protein [Rhizobium lusitanum]